MGTGPRADGSQNAGNGDHHHVHVTPETVDWGYFDPSREPVLTVKSGDVVTMETVTIPEEDDHAAFLRENGINKSDICQKEVEISKKVKPSPGHVVTGPVAIEGAEPGDTLEVHVRSVEVVAQYGMNYRGPGGVLSDTVFDQGETSVIPFDDQQEMALFSEGSYTSVDQDITIPLEPFIGVMAVSPRPSEGKIGTIVPSYYGGNMDNRHLGSGATVYLPISAEGALFWAGDGHAVQGNGEVSLTALETTLTPTFEFTLHKETRLEWPVAETEEYYIPMGFDEHLNLAMERSVRAAISLLHHQEGLDPLDAYGLCSLAVDFNITETVNNIQIVHAMIPKSVFSEGDGIDPEDLSVCKY